MKEETVTSNRSSQANVVNKGNRVLKLGLDMHYRQVTVAMQEDGGRIKGAGKMRHADFLNWSAQKVGRKLGNLQLFTKPEPAATGYIASWCRWESKTWWWCPLCSSSVLNILLAPRQQR
jgi:hypothetical protein